VEIESWDAGPQRPKLDLDGQNLLKRLRHERYAKTGGYQPQHAECAIRFLSRNLGHKSRGTAKAHEPAMIRRGCLSNRNKFLIRQCRQPQPPLFG
jgi:hypothetical protein